jgi:hypothetical protein
MLNLRARSDAGAESRIKRRAEAARAVAEDIRPDFLKTQTEN